MKQNKKRGFTLIELLAVIVILAIIALIAVPVIMNIINKANKSAFKDSAYGVISAGELYYAEQLLEPSGMTSDVTIDLPDTTKKLQIKGEVPTGSILITTEGKVAIAVHNNRYCVTKGIDDKDITVTEDIANCNLPGGEVNPPESGGDQGTSGGAVTPKNSLNEYTWDEIQAIAKSDAALYNYNIAIGDTITDDTYTYYLVSDERSEAYDGLVFMYKSGVKAQMNSINKNYGGYANSEMKETVNNIYNNLEDAEVKAAIKEVTIACNDSKYEADGTTTSNHEPNYVTAHMFLPSVREVSGTKGYSSSIDNYQTLNGALDTEGSTFDYFKDETKLNGLFYSSSAYWWLRSAVGDVSSSFWVVRGGDGIITSSGANGPQTVIPAFVIG